MVERQGPFLGELEILVLLAILRLGPECYSTTIQTELRERAGRTVALGSLHVVLTRLRNKNMLDSWLGEPMRERGGQARRHYRLTAEGVQAVRQSRDMFTDMWAGLHEALGPA